MTNNKIYKNMRSSSQKLNHKKASFDGTKKWQAERNFPTDGTLMKMWNFIVVM